MASQLLPSSESHAFQTFLSSVDYSDSQVAPEWSMYTPPDHPADEITRARATKVTKDFMSLDVIQDGLLQSHSQPQTQSQPQHFEYDQSQRQHYAYEFRHEQSPFQHRQPEIFPFFKHTQSRPPFQHSQLQSIHQQQHNHLHHPYTNQRHALGITVAPSHTVTSSASPPPSASTSYVPSLHAPFSSSQTPSSNSLHRSPSLSKHSISHDQLARSSSHKRPRASPGPSTSAPSSSSLVLPLPRLPHPPIQPGSPPLPYISHPPKATLLSPSQKKANHIQSEQKRRANIRRGYEALCETVPALREAIKEEEAMALAANDDSRSGGVAMKGRGKRGRGRGKLEDGEKIDGRAGPRSENVVLSKTIDYINELLAEYAALLSRLKRAEGALPPGAHGKNGVVSSSRDVVPLWEREWKGGEGRSDVAEEEEEDEESS